MRVPLLLHVFCKFLVSGLILSLFLTVPARAQTIIRDAEIEYSLRKLAQPLAVAAGINPRRLRILILNDSSLNAFVANSQTIFLHSGLILKLDSAVELQAVLAHEMAHIANGHITRRLSNARGAGTAAGLGLVLAAAVAATGNSQAATGVAIGSSSSAQRAFFVHTRGEEASADQSAARYMARAGISPSAMVGVLEIFKDQEALSANSNRVDPYVRTHPLTSERLRAAKGYAVAYPVKNGPNADSEYWFARARGKLGAFLQNPNFTLRKVKKSDGSDVALMRRAIAYHKKSDTPRAIKEIDKLIAKRPKDPFTHELKGQILLESRRFPAAVSAYSRAVQISPKEPQILAGLGKALLALNTADGNRRALLSLKQAQARDPYSGSLLRDLGQAYARAGNNGMSSLSTAERYALSGRLRDATIHAKRAVDLLPRGSSGWQRAQDILAAAKRSKR